jgi:hypothetical protein
MIVDPALSCSAVASASDMSRLGRGAARPLTTPHEQANPNATTTTACVPVKERVVPAVGYLGAMSTGAEARSYGTVFNDVAGEYDRHRPTYPDALVDQACEVADVAPGDPVLEIGSGTGQLTRPLLDRGLRVTAVEPGDQLIARASDQLRDAGDVQFVNARLEDASLPGAYYRAVFSASAIHWIDPDVGWRKAAATSTERSAASRRGVATCRRCGGGSEVTTSRAGTPRNYSRKRRSL